MDIPHRSFGPVILRRTALTQGYSDNELASLRRSRSLAVLRQGAYLDPDLTGELEGYERYRLLVAATATRLVRPAVFSHASAAVMHGLPLRSAEMVTVHITRRPGATTSQRRTLRCHVAGISDNEIELVDGLSVTSPARTVVDLARTIDLESAVIAADDAVHRGLTDLARLTEAVDGLRGVPGIRSAYRVLELTDGRSESVGETRSRLVLTGLGLPPIQSQVEVRDARGRLVARCDFGIPALRVYGEFDGRVKYGRLLKPGQEPGDVVFEEKRREDSVRDVDGGEMVRWTWSEIATPQVIGDRWWRAIDRAVLRRS